MLQFNPPVAIIKIVARRNSVPPAKEKKIRPAAITILFLAVLPSYGRTIYVARDAIGENNGASWKDAYNYLQDALAFAQPGDEVRVAGGVYVPDQFVLSERPNIGRKETFLPDCHVTLRGGYAGPSHPDPNERDIYAHETILSGDLNGDDHTGGDNSENSYNVVTSYELSPESVIDGFTITAGNANHPDSDRYGNGGGLWNFDGCPTIIDCTFKGNYTASKGGGMHSTGGNATLLNCRFVKNHALSIDPGYGFGGGMSSLDGGPLLIDCIFADNVSDRAGGMYSNCMGYDGNSPTLIRCTFTGNSARGGGGLSINYDTSTLINCLFSGNSVTYGGAAISGHQTCPTILNCTFSDNSAAGTGGAIALNHSDCTSGSLTNCIFWANEAQEGPEIALYDTTLTISYCDIQGGKPDIWINAQASVNWGRGNIDADPCFADAEDYHLLSQAGRWDSPTETWLLDSRTSPCIDAGSPATAIGPESFPNGGIINMGAYGGTTQASKSYFYRPLCENIVPGDINGDCIVDYRDLAIFSQNWLERREPGPKYQAAQCEKPCGD